MRPDTALRISLLHLDEHNSAAPDVSPGVVQDSEFLLRELFNPQHISDGKLLPAAIALDDLRSRGFSVHRVKYVTKEHVKASIDDKLSRPRVGTQWTDEGVAKFQAVAVRRLRIDGEQVLVVIDTAHESNRGHASILAAAPGKGKAHARELRSLLLPLLQARVSLEEVFE